MNQKEIEWDRLLKIRTGGRDDSNSDQYRYPYEPTPYCVLERLANSGYIGKKNILLDYGCGKGRVDFFFSYQTRCQAIGVDFDDRLIQLALQNQVSSVSRRRCEFLKSSAEQYGVPAGVDRCYFFNPFSIEILQTVLGKIAESYYENPREILLFFYYPSDTYMGKLMTTENLMFTDEIDCRDLFEGENERERIVIFEIV